MKASVYIAFIVIFISCDKIEPPFKETNNNQNIVDTNSFYNSQKILIEEFTGHRCGNCPRAHEKIEELKGIYSNKIIAVSIHAGFFAEPLPPNYPNDFRTNVGNELYSFFGVQSTPIGLINRKKINDTYLINYENWSVVISDIITQSPAFLINVTPSIINDSNTINAKVIIKVKTDSINNIRLSVFLTEDSIISSQTDYSHSPTLISNYVHNNVLRASFNGTWGTEITLINKSINDTVIRNFTLNVNSLWKLKNCKIVAFIYDPDIFYVYQVEEKKLFDK
ncbi:MAG: Omp28 family outer membrane lipoprotein [Bacteroidales bacterium]|nr:Omp28 family outer membrane lipoprotein [Bacteroidales bacterium]